jgi:zinc D-Ala-D-Ala carboxypeptidase
MNKKLTISVITIILIISASGFIYQRNYFKKQISNLLSEIQKLKDEGSTYIGQINSFKDTIFVLEEKIKEKEEQVEEAEGELEEAQDELRQLGRDVKIITKIIGTDEQLLQKYSKVYFLNEHYTPKKLSYISDIYLSNKDKALQIHSDIKDYLEEMIDDANDDGVSLKVLSAYRSFNEQTSIKSNYKVVYGSGANAFSADQGYSEHQLGTTVDLTSQSMGSTLGISFDTTPEFKWLTKNAYKYGFVMSYPKNNSYYQYEPWHWRFVGKDLAKDLHDDGKYFYDLDQREIYQYLGSFFE